MIAFAPLLLAGLAFAEAGQSHPDPSQFRRDTPAVAAKGTKPGPGMGRVSRESLAIAACRTRAARLGEAKFGDLRLAGYRTFLVTGTIAPPRSARRRTPLTFRCTVRGESEILDFTTSRTGR